MGLDASDELFSCALISERFCWMHSKAYKLTLTSKYAAQRCICLHLCPYLRASFSSSEGGRFDHERNCTLVDVGRAAKAALVYAGRAAKAALVYAGRAAKAALDVIGL